MKNCSHPLTAPPSVIFPEVGASKQQRITWLIQLCKKHVKNYVMLPEMTTIVNQTDELHNVPIRDTHVEWKDVKRAMFAMEDE